jgi:hypothetical protein
VALNTGTAGTFGGNASLALASTGAGTTGAPDLDLPSQTVALTGRVYTPAQAQLSPTTIDFGIVHVGDAVAARALSVTNIAPATALTTSCAAASAGPLARSVPGARWGRAWRPGRAMRRASPWA